MEDTERTMWVAIETRNGGSDEKARIECLFMATLGLIHGM